MLKLTPQNFQAEVLKADLPVLVEASATWCGPCRTVARIVEKLATDRPDLKICVLDVDKCSDLADKYKVQSVPMFLLFQNGKQLEFDPLLVGVLPKKELAARIDERLAEAAEKKSSKVAAKSSKAAA